MVLLTRPISIGINEDSRLFGEVGCIGNVVAAGDEEDEDNKDGEMEEHTGWYPNPNLYELKDQLDTYQCGRFPSDASRVSLSYIWFRIIALAPAWLDGSMKTKPDGDSASSDWDEAEAGSANTSCTAHEDSMKSA